MTVKSSVLLIGLAVGLLVDSVQPGVGAESAQEQLKKGRDSALPTPLPALTGQADRGRGFLESTLKRRAHGFVPAGGLQWWYLTGHLWQAGVEPGQCPAHSLAAGPSAGAAHRDAQSFDPKTLGVVFPAPEPLYGIQLTFFAAQQDQTWGLLGHAAESRPGAGTHVFNSWVLPFDPHVQGAFNLARVASPLGSDQGLEAGDLDLRLGLWAWRQISTLPDVVWLLEFDVSGVHYALLADVPARPWLHGQSGVTEKLSGSHNLYYSFPFISVRGTRTEADGRKQPVCGSVWMDREIGVSGVNRSGWHWFALRFPSGKAVMVYALFQSGSQKPERVLGEVWDERSGQSSSLDDLQIEPGSISCLKSKRCYPLQHTIRFAFNGQTVELSASSPFPEQEIVPSAEGLHPPYWEGPVRVDVSKGSSVLGASSGLGYLEMVLVSE